MKKIDVTEFVDFGNPDDESLPIITCVCGKRFELWKHTISIYEEYATECPECGAKLIFGNAIRVYQIVEEE